MSTDNAMPDATPDDAKAPSQAWTISEGTCKGKGKEENPAPNGESHRMLALPAELIANILSYLSPVELSRVSATCRALYAHAMEDRLWQAHVQANVPGQRVTSPYPCSTFRELFVAHDPRWFLPRYKIWFADTRHLGKLALVRYDQRRGCIEGYYLLATNRDLSDLVPLADNLFVRPFDPEVKLHLDQPNIRLPAIFSEDRYGTADSVLTLDLHAAASDDGGDEPGTSSSQPTGQFQNPMRPSSFRDAIVMDLGPSSHVKTSFHLARCLSPEEAAAHAVTFSSDNVWPPPAIPATHRVLGTGLERPSYLRADDCPASRSEVYDRAFRISTSFEISTLEDSLLALQAASNRGVSFLEDLRVISRAIRFGPGARAPRRVPLGAEIATYATLDPALYTPTARKPFRGIWVGEYGGHGCEFLLLHQPDDDDDNDDDDNDDGDGDGDPESSGVVPRLEGETEAAYAARRRDAAVYRGRLEAIKLTGDGNVPRGEYSFVVNDLGPDGFLGVAEDEPFAGARRVRSRGHIARGGFVNDEYIETELVIISPNKLAHKWFLLGHVSYLHRVDIDQFLVPD